jgi:hypothetical protein
MPISEGYPDAEGGYLIKVLIQGREKEKWKEIIF